MSNISIHAERLGKKYRLRHQQPQRYLTLRDTVSEKARQLFRGAALPRVGGSEDFWALRDVSFEVKQGEVIGIIGRNGAGKSTLLKILSRITEPTEGWVGINGRVGSLLEVGTGFHPELTGRENIYLNGAVLGMRRAEIQRKFDEIVAFAEIEKFLDTPVKRYSTGMYVRLAFAVAAHLEPELLVVDEVLAVGDAEFQKKCLGKMEDVSHKEGRTVLFVSHNMGVIQSLCPHSLLLDAGRVRFFGPTAEAVPLYLSAVAATLSFERPAQPSGAPTITRGALVVEEERLIFDLEITSAQSPNCTLGIKLHDNLGGAIGCAAAELSSANKALQLRSGVNHLRCALRVPRLAVGRYFVSMQLNIPWVQVLDDTHPILQFDVERGGLRQEWNSGSIEIPMTVTALQETELFDDRPES